MGVEFDPAWEYWTPSDPEVAEILAEAAKLDGFGRLGVEERRSLRSGALTGVRFGRGNPDFFVARFGPPRPERTRETVQRRKCPGCERVWQPDRNSRLYCSLDCRPYPGSKRKLEPVNCKGCSKKIWRTHQRQKYCSLQCVPPPPPKPVKANGFDRETLRLMYERGDPMADIEAVFNAGRKTIRKTLKQIGAKMRPAGWQHRKAAKA